MPVFHLALLLITSTAAQTASAPTASIRAQDAQDHIALPAGHVALLDGRCEPAEWGNAQRVRLSESVALLAMHDPDAVHLCVLGPADSHNTLDLYLEAPGVPTLINLHASAQIGERRLAADGYGDYQWGNHQDWYSPPVPFRGMSGEGAQRRVDFQTGVPREVTLLKSRFGALPWKVRIEVGGTRNAEGEWIPLLWPTTAASQDHTEGWAELRAGQ